jgi:hypothetical protein
MRLSLKLTILVSFTSLLTSVTAIHGQEKVDNIYFSLKVPNTWSYAKYSNTKMATLFGKGPVNQIILVPQEFRNNLLNSNLDGARVYENIYDTGAFSQFTQDTDYNIKNAPLTMYLKYFASKYIFAQL